MQTDYSMYGKSIILSNVLSDLLNGTGSSYTLPNISEWIEYFESRIHSNVQIEIRDKSNLDIRTPIEHIENIKEILKITISKLANVFGVTRQSVYKWMEDQSKPEEVKLKKIHQLSLIADRFKSAEVLHPDSLICMKMFSGKSLMDILTLDEDPKQYVDALIIEAKIMDQAYKKIKLSKSPPTDNWRSSISIPRMNEDND